ncbi:hypothetical protein PR003_g31059 [Phytophthora rubi]|uniref:Uncharacterized protein n=1 Tax=Phytophthora rubi TaxID=129364 RepID=A0A6A3GWX9_9STRA|nr:hypothetical protein PR002_g29862 [Phytophthora rubi]KAE8961701.1 hypothetical protein PR001_g29959 [Phytophthora rubi]KAE9269715.1 hypothetical protein PR003_g31059 [Phytophthora rubi]
MLLLMLNLLPFGFGLRTAAEAGQTEESSRATARSLRALRHYLSCKHAAANYHIDIVKLLLQTRPHQLANLSVNIRKSTRRLMTTGIQHVAARGAIETLQLLLYEPCSLLHLRLGLKLAAANGHITL